MDSNFGRLNYDCLAHIFSCLPIVDRLSAELVCKQWYSASQESWRSLKRLDVDKAKWQGGDLKESKDRVKMTMYKIILQRCGRYLTEIDFTYLCTRTDSDIFVFNRYETINHFIYGSQEKNLDGIHALAFNCTQIEKLSLCSSIIRCDNLTLMILFKANKKIQYLNLIGYDLSGSCFFQLPAEMITTLLIQRCRVGSENLYMLLQKCTKLRILSLWRTTTSSSGYYYPMNNMKLVSSNIIKNLEELYLEDIVTFEPDDFDCLLHFHFNVTSASANLTAIQINNVRTNDYVDQILIGIGANCKNLKMADFSGCSHVTDKMLVNITTLPKLEMLCIDKLSKITDMPLVHLSEHLKVLRCAGCKVTDAGLSRILSTSPNIELMELSFCKNITNEIVNYAIDITKNRTNNVVLNMYVKNTLIEECKIKKNSPFLRLHKKMYNSLCGLDTISFFEIDIFYLCQILDP